MRLRKKKTDKKRQQSSDVEISRQGSTSVEHLSTISLYSENNFLAITDELLALQTCHLNDALDGPLQLLGKLI